MIQSNIAKQPRKVMPASSQTSAAGQDRMTITPPKYGIDWIDTGSNPPVAGSAPSGGSPLQRMAGQVRAGSDPARQPTNRTGLPDTLKSGIEGLSGLSLDDVRVHFNSPRPAQLQALAYTRGNEIHVAPGQERHLPHEAWHVVQQKTGRVTPTLQVSGININDDARLENEATRQGTKALKFHPYDTNTPEFGRAVSGPDNAIVQRIGTEREDAKFAATARIKQQKPSNLSLMTFLYGKVTLRKSNGSYSRPLALASIGEAMVEFIHENPNEPDNANPIFKYEPATVNIIGHMGAEMKDVVLGEVDAIMEYLEGKARTGGGGGLFQSNPDMRWAMLSPKPPKGVWTPIHSQFQTLPGWESPVSYPAHGGKSEPQIQTPSGSEMDWYTTYSWDSPGGSQHRLHAYGKDVEKHQSSFPSSLQTTLGTPKLGAFTGTTKTALSQEIDQKLLNKWAGQRKGFKPGQNAAMTNTSAADAALASFGTPAKDHSWQWLHLIAFTLGGDSRDTANPNTEENLVAGLAAANGHHLVLENLVKRMILGNKFKKVKLTAKANMIQNSFHVASSIDYTVEGVSASKTSYEVIAAFHIDTLDPSKSTGSDLTLLAQTFKL